MDSPFEAKLNRMRVIDLNASSMGMSSDEEERQAMAAFEMGWRAKRAGNPRTGIPTFADDSLRVDWLNGWDAA